MCCLHIYTSIKKTDIDTKKTAGIGSFINPNITQMSSEKKKLQVEEKVDRNLQQNIIKVKLLIDEW